MLQQSGTPTQMETNTNWKWCRDDGALRVQQVHEGGRVRHAMLHELGWHSLQQR